MSAPRIVVIGGGFAGVKCAQVLRRQARDADIVLFARDNHMVFQPLLPDVAGSSLNPRAIAPPLRQLLPGVRCRSETVTAIDLAGKTLQHGVPGSPPRTMAFDHLVLACGNVANLALLPGMADHALPLKTIGDAINVRAHVIDQLERAEAAECPEERHRHLTVVVIGGGFSGVEVAGELNDLMRSLLPRYPGIRADEISVTLLHSQDLVLPEVDRKLREFAQKKMVQSGVRVRTGCRAREVTGQGVTLSDGERIAAATVICTIGTTVNPLISGLGLDLDRGRLPTGPDMQLAQHPGVWAVGDCALVHNAHDDAPAPPTAQFAERQGRQCAENIARALRGEATRPFRFKLIGVACGIGGRRGVAQIYGMKFSGFIAWWLWRSAFLAKIPSLAQKIKVGLDWAWELIFHRDLSHFRAQRSEPISRAHFATGERVLRRRPELEELYSIERGEVAVVAIGAGGERELFRLGPGALIGEATLAEPADGEVELRALTPVDLLVMGKQALSRLSAALRPLEAVLERAIDRPKLRIWQHHQHAMVGLAQVPADRLPHDSAPLVVAHEDPLGPAYTALIERGAGCLLVTEQGRLTGIATRTDLLAELARGATRDSPIGMLTNRAVHALRHDATAAAAAELMADHGLKYLPLVDAGGAPCGLLRSDDFVRFALARERTAEMG
ncbi:MAG: FAD-dependent oxidoreductase [Xanthomonadales bacterium]|nr:FAD-dependent oxidoreductase [Xanthomonadales bacterium]